MYDLADFRRIKSNKYVMDFPEGILDVIEADYPKKYALIVENHNLMATLFSNDEWLQILTKSRNSYQDQIRRMKLNRRMAQGI